MKHRLLMLYCWVVRSLMYFLPDIPMIMRFRGWLYSLAMQSAGSNIQIAHNVILNSIENLIVGNNIYIGQFSVLYATGRIIINDHVMIGPNCLISSSNHSFRNKSYWEGQRICKQVSIGSGSWVAGHCTIVAGGSLPVRSILAAGSVLTHDFQEEGIYGGTPAKLIKKGQLIFSYE